MFNSYKNYLDVDVSYMQNRYVLEGWLFANFIAMITYYKLYVRLLEAELLSKHSPKDIHRTVKSNLSNENRGRMASLRNNRENPKKVRQNRNKLPNLSGVRDKQILMQ